MFLLHNTFEKLDLEWILEKVHVSCVYGKDRKSRIFPYRSEQALEEEFDVLERVTERMRDKKRSFTKIRHLLAEIKEIRGTLRRLENGETLTVIELFELKKFALSVRYLSQAVEDVKGIQDALCPSRMVKVEALLDPRRDGVPTFHLYEEYSQILKEQRGRIADIEQELSDARKRLVEDCAKAYGLTPKSSGVLRVSREHEDLEAIRQDHRMEYVAEEFGLLQFRVRLAGHGDLLEALEEAKRKEQVEEEKIKEDLSRGMSESLELFRINIEKIGHLDLMVGKAAFAIGYHLTRPEIIEDQVIEIVGGINIPVSDNLKREGLAYTPIDIVLRQGATIVTGSNMGGKTVTLKLIGQITALAQWGFFVPAKHVRLSLRDYIYISVGDSQDIDLGLSSFAGEMVSLAKVIEDAERPGLILVDELSRGTNPQEGYAISRSITDHLNEAESISVFTSHFDGIAEDKVHYQVKGLRNVQIGSDSLIASLHKQMDYRLERVDGSKKVPKEAIPIAQLLGLDPAIIEKARNYLTHSGRSGEHEQ